MDENTWRLAQVGMWLVGIQTTVIIAIIGAMWASMTRKFDAVDKRFESVDKRFEALEVKICKKIDDLEYKITAKIEKLDEKVTDIDRQVCKMEGRSEKLIPFDRQPIKEG